MCAMFLLPTDLFLPAAFLSTTCMILITYKLTRYSGLFRPRWRNLIVGVISAGGLYGLFLIGNYGIKALHPLGISSSSETSIYSLIASHSLFLQIAILVLDALGYESYFRGSLQNYFLARKGRSLAIGAVFASAFVDALIHLVTFNPLWVITTFIVDSVWGVTYYYAQDLSASVASHLVWDVMIFILFPIK